MIYIFLKENEKNEARLTRKRTLEPIESDSGKKLIEKVNRRILRGYL